MDQRAELALGLLPERNDLFHYTFNNHLTYGWVLQPEPNGRAKYYATKIGSCERPPQAPIDEASAAAKLIRETFPGQIVLCMSSGADSECMAQAFLRAKIPFKVATAIYQPGQLNAEDIDSIVTYCKHYDLEHEFIDIDVETFFSSRRHLDCARRWQCASPQVALHIEFIERITRRKELPVLAWNPIEIGLNKYRLNFGEFIPSVFLPCEPHFATLRFLKEHGYPGIPFFFAYTPELIYSFWRTPEFHSNLRQLESVIRSPQDYDLYDYWSDQRPSRYASKILKYNQGGFKILARPRKLTGFEGVKAYFRNKFDSFAQDSEPFDSVFRKEMEEIAPYPLTSSQIFSGRYFPQTTLFQLPAKSHSPEAKSICLGVTGSQER